ncbi:MAG: hypothetical protein IKE92_15175 [Clostridiales bacterium]|nr:hypothetical protein [Clostridiales bacterium]
MQDEYVKTFAKIHIDDDRKMEMRKALEMEMASVRKPAKRTHLGTGAKVGIAAAALAVSVGGLLAFPPTRNVIAASVRSLFKIVVPDDATDVIEQVNSGREERVIPTDDVSESEAEEMLAIVASQDAEEDNYLESVIVSADYYTDPDLNELANYYAQQGYSILDLQKDSMFLDYEHEFDTRDWYSEGFFLTFQIGDNATSRFGTIMAFKATEDQLDGFLKNKLDLINYEREEHGQSTVAFDELWTRSTDDEGNIVYKGSWTGPEPEMKILPSDSARFMTFEVTYDTDTQIVTCYIEEGGGIG